MARKKLGYVELEWTCPACSRRNPGSRKSCLGCGLAMPEGLSFELPAQQTLDTSAETEAQVAAGPDIHCPYCGARNPGNAQKCVQCSGDLSEGVRRAQGQVLGALQTEKLPDVACPHCGAMNQATAVKCVQCGGPLPKQSASRPPHIIPQQPVPPNQSAPAKRSSPFVWLMLAFIGLVGCAVLFTILTNSKTTETIATVRQVEWSYAIHVEQLMPVTREDWRDRVPAGAQISSCTRRVRRTVPDPVPGATEVCGTPYVRDTGTGKGEVVQDCQYQVTDDWCKYTVQEWQVVNDVVAKGTDLNPHWPAVSLLAGQREKGRSESYKVLLDADGKNYTYSPKDLQSFRAFTPGSRWVITVNALGGVRSLRPAS